MKLSKLDTKKSHSSYLGCFQYVAPSSPLSHIDSDSDMDAEGDPDPDCVQMAVAVNEVAATVSCGVDSPKSRPSKPDEEVSLLMNVDGGPQSVETRRATGEDERNALASSTSSVQHVIPELRALILQYWKGYNHRYRKDSMKAEELWAEKHAGLLGNCTNCRPERECVFHPGRAKCTNCTKGKIRCSHMDIFKTIWVAEQVKTTPEVVRGVAVPEDIPRLRATRRGKASESGQRKRRQPKVTRRPSGLRTSNRLQVATKNQENTRNSCAVSLKPDELDVIGRKEGSSSSETDPEMQIDQDHDIGPIVNSPNPTSLTMSVTTDIHDDRNLNLEQSHFGTDSTGGIGTEVNAFEDVRASTSSDGVLESPVTAIEGIVSSSVPCGLPTIKETSHLEPPSHDDTTNSNEVITNDVYFDTPSPDGNEREEMEAIRSNATLQAWTYIVRAEAALKDGYSEEVKGYLDGAIGSCEALFR